MDNKRRNFLGYMAVLGLSGIATIPVYAKIPQLAIEYQETPKNGQKCKDCMHFLPETSECTLVEGIINPEGWCRLYILPPEKREGAKPATS